MAVAGDAELGNMAGTIDSTVADSAHPAPFRLLDLPDELILRVLSSAAVIISTKSRPITITSVPRHSFCPKTGKLRRSSARSFATVFQSGVNHPRITQVCKFLRHEGE